MAMPEAFRLYQTIVGVTVWRWWWLAERYALAGMWHSNGKGGSQVNNVSVDAAIGPQRVSCMIPNLFTVGVAQVFLLLFLPALECFAVLRCLRAYSNDYWMRTTALSPVRPCATAPHYAAPTLGWRRKHSRSQAHTEPSVYSHHHWHHTVTTIATPHHPTYTFNGNCYLIIHVINLCKVFYS